MKILLVEDDDRIARPLRGQRTKRKNLYAKCKNLADINIKCTMILAKVITLKSGINQE